MSPWFWIGFGAISVYVIDGLLYIVASVHLRWLRKANLEIEELIERERKRLHDLDQG